MSNLPAHEQFPVPPPPDPADEITPAQMRRVLEVSRMLAVTSDLDKLLREIAESTTSLLDCERASIFLHDARTDELWTKVALQSTEIRLASNRGIVGHAFKSNSVLNIPKPYEDARFNPLPDRASGFVTRSILAVPMVDWERNPVGVIQAINKREAAFSGGDIALLQLLADQAGVAIQRFHLQQSAVQSTALRKEMELAKQVQEATLPRGAVDVSGLCSRGWTQPASINGGDCYDLWPLPDGRLGVLVADASGHGLAPALVVSQVRALVRTLSDAESDPARILLRINQRLVQDLDRGRFCTIFLAFVASDGTVNWCSGGHGPILLHNPGRAIEVLDATMPPIGVVEDLPNSAPGPATLLPGGWLIVPTDGITESLAPDGRMLGLQGVLDALAADQFTTPEQLVAGLQQTLKQWQQGQEPEDDQSVVVVRRGAGGEDGG